MNTARALVLAALPLLTLVARDATAAETCSVGKKLSCIRSCPTVASCTAKPASVCPTGDCSEKAIRKGCKKIVGRCRTRCRTPCLRSCEGQFENCVEATNPACRDDLPPLDCGAVVSTCQSQIAAYCRKLACCPIIGGIKGTFEGYSDGGYDRLDFTGNIAFDRDPNDPGDMGGANGTYLLTSADYTVTASGGGAYGCQRRGVQHFEIPAHNVGGLSVLGNGANFGPPYGYSWFAAFPGHPTMNVELSDCPMGEEGHNGEVVEVDAQVTIGDNGGAISADGITYADSWTDSSSGNTLHVSWSFQGS